MALSSLGRALAVCAKITDHKYSAYDTLTPETYDTRRYLCDVTFAALVDAGYVELVSKHRIPRRAQYRLTQLGLETLASETGEEG